MKIISLIFFIAIIECRARGMEYFDTKIDFWGESKKNTDVKSLSPVQEEKREGKFPWKTYLDPKNKEFFKEGDYTPPEPFMEIARNPSDENIKMWFEFMKKKNELAKNLDLRMQEYMSKNQSVLPSIVPQGSPIELKPAVKKTDSVNRKVDPARFKLRMYFESTCPHCQRMFGVLKSFQDQGFQVEALQVDRGEVPSSEKIIPIGRAEPQELKKHGIKGVPFLLIADAKRKALLPAIEGYHDLNEIMQLLKAAD